MSDTSSFLSLPYIQASQAQKHITHNEGMRILDSLVQLSVVSADLTVPPAAPSSADRYIVGPGGAEDWAGYDGHIAVWDENHWRFYAPLHGWTAWDQKTDTYLAYDGSTWAQVVPTVEQLEKLGINTAADATNRLAVSSDATLMSHNGQGHQIKVNKAGLSDTASLLFQTNWSGRAEMGTVGDDQFTIKVSPDGNQFQNAMVVDPADATARFPQGTHMGYGDTSDLRITKDTGTDTAAVRFQTAGTDHAVLGANADNDLTLKVSADGATFQDAIHVNRTTGEVTFPNTVIGGSEFGTGDLLTVDYIAAKGTDLVTNGTGLLGNNYNMPADFQYDAANTPGLPASFSYAGYYGGLRTISEFIPINPSQTYRLSTYIKQEALPNPAAYAYEGRHMQYMGLLAYDVDKNLIRAEQHMRYKAEGVESRTTLAAPLTPGDTQIHLSSAAGWNDTLTSVYRRGIIIFGYKNSQGSLYKDYSRFVKFNLFDPSNVDKTNNTVTLNAGLPASLGNPEDPNGTWPTGTSIANSSVGELYKYSLLYRAILPTSSDWYYAENHMGGVDRSGTNVSHNFTPGTAFVKLFWLPNHSNRSGGFGLHSDTGADHRIWFAGISVTPDYTAVQSIQPDGAVALKKQVNDFDAGTVSLAPTGLSLFAVE